MNHVSKYRYFPWVRSTMILSPNSLFTASVLSRQGLAFLTNLLLARFVVAETYADYASYINVGSYLLLLGNFGFSEYSLIQSSKKGIRIENYIIFFLFIAVAILGTIISVGLLVKCSLLFLLVIGRIFFDIVVSEILLSWYQKQNLFSRLAKFNFVYSFGSLILVGILWRGDISLQEFLIGAIIVTGTLSILQIIPIYKSFLANNEANNLIPPIDKEIMYYGLNYVTVPIYMRLIPLLVVLMLDKKSIAEFHLAFTIASACLIVALSQIKVILPKLISSPNIRYILLNNIKILTVINISLFLGFLLFGNFFIEILYPKDGYSELYFLTLCMLLANVFQTISGILACALSAKNFQRKKLRIQLEIIVFSLILGLPLIKLMGNNGGALTLLLTYLYVIGRYTYTLRRLGLLKIS